MNACPVCNKHFSQRSAIKSHLTVHTGEKPFSCDMCNRAFNDRSSLRKHKFVHTGEKPYTCDVCLKSFTQRITLTRHQFVHTKPYKCSVCPREFTREISLKRHALIHSQQKENICRYCKNNFPSNDELKIHMLVCKYEIAQKINFKEELFVRPKKKYKKTPFKCNICGKEFKHEIHLKTHLLLHISNPDFFCQECGKPFDKCNQCEIHAKAHNDVTITFICEFCKKGFPTMEELKTHESSHKTPDEIVIHMPGTSIANSANVTDNCETENCIIICDKCGNTFYSNHDYSCHLSVHELPNDQNQINSDSENNTVKLCEICGDIFDNERLFSEHLPFHFDNGENEL